MLTLVVGYRDREIERVERCLDSLAKQTFGNFDLIFVDYGSAGTTAAAAKRTIKRYPFARYVYTDSRGWPWNRSRALNIGLRLAQSDYAATTDVDMIFDPDFLRIAMEHAGSGRAVYCRPRYLPRGFDRWDDLTRRAGTFWRGNEHGLGGFMCAPTKVLHQLHGFDEYYRYWGVEDRDLNHRLKAAGLEQTWLPDDARMFHQWHPDSNFLTAGYMPDGVWQRMSIHFERQKDLTVRNTDRWGTIYRPEQRAVWRFVDPDAGRLIPNDRLVMVDLPPDSRMAVGGLLRQLWQLPSDHALAVDHAGYPGRTRWIDAIIRLVNGICSGLGSRARIEYRHNLLHDTISDCLFECENVVADYYLNLPASDGLTVMVRA